VVIVQPNFIDELIKAGKLWANERSIVGRVGIGLFVRAKAPVPDISTSPSLKKALLNADAIVFNNVASGNYFDAVLDRLEIADAVKSKVTRASPVDVASLIVQGKGNDIGVGTIPLIMVDKRLTLVGPLPSNLLNYLVYAAAIARNAQSLDAGREFIRYLASRRLAQLSRHPVPIDLRLKSGGVLQLAQSCRGPRSVDASAIRGPAAHASDSLSGNQGAAFGSPRLFR
jgi:molybdate transport system substrate-binding protein